MRAPQMWWWEERPYEMKRKCSHGERWRMVESKDPKAPSERWFDGNLAVGDGWRKKLGNWIELVGCPAQHWQQTKNVLNCSGTAAGPWGIGPRGKGTKKLVGRRNIRLLNLMVVERAHFSGTPCPHPPRRQFNWFTRSLAHKFHTFPRAKVKWINGCQCQKWEVSSRSPYEHTHFWFSNCGNWREKKISLPYFWPLEYAEIEQMRAATNFGRHYAIRKPYMSSKNGLN